jgi:hypothetical protein
MTTYDDNLLAARFAALAPEPLAGNWDDVLRRAGAMREQVQSLERSRAREGHRRRFLVVLAAAILVVVVGTAAAFGIRSYILERGFIGLPPEGATPSVEQDGDIVLHYFGPGPKGTDGKRRVWVYADGRVVWLGGGDVPEAANPTSSGFLEQRLTSEGVELVRSTALAAGTFSNDPPPVPPPPPCPRGVSPGTDGCAAPTPLPDPDQPLVVPFYVDVIVPEVGRLARVDRASDLDRIIEHLTDMTAWLPATAWADEAVRAYVPSRFAVCYGSWPPDRPVDESRILGLLPGGAQELIRSRDALAFHGLFGGPLDGFRPVVDHCVEMPTNEARIVLNALETAGFERFMPGVRLAFRLPISGSTNMVHIYFEPYLPHGEITCSACG